MKLISPPTDSDLLSRYMKAGDERAFGMLVRTHEGLVIGTAARITGSVELARDVAQHVFATLARKGWLLTNRTCLAGWLHHASRHLALRAVRAERARERRHERFALEIPATPESDLWPMLEEALAALPDAEREAVVMHHLQDCSYAEMAKAMGLTEAAARKRVSRGLKSLGGQLRERGFGGSAAALLAGAAAIQVVGPSLAVAGTLTAASSVSLTFATLMTHTAVKIAAGLILVTGIPIVWQRHENAALREQLTALQQQPWPMVTNESAGPASFAPSPEPEALRKRILEARQAQAEAQAGFVKAEETVTQLEEEVVISHGTVEELARAFVNSLLPLVEEMKAMEQMDETEQTAREAELTNRMLEVQSQVRPLVKAMCKLEDQPAEAARIQAIIFTEVLGLSAADSQRVESALSADFQKLRNDGLIYSLRPRDNVEAWVERRREASVAMEKHIKPLLPAEVRNHPIFENEDGLLMDLSRDEFDYLEAEIKATPQPAAKQP